MSKDKSHLGKGLDSLLGDRVKKQPQGQAEIAIEDLVPGQFQPRKKMFRNTLEELSESIKQQGVLQPLVVRRQATGQFEIVVGERRWRAAQMAGLKTVPVVIKDLSNEDTAKIALIENLQREDLNAMDQARGLLRLQREFNLSQELLAGSVGKSRTSVTNLLRLLNLSTEVQDLLESGKIDMGHARAILGLPDDKQLSLALEVVEKSLSVRETEKLVSSKKANTTASKPKGSKDPNTLSLERQISETLGAKVEIKHNKKGRGRLIVNFKNLNVLQGILEKIKTN